MNQDILSLEPYSPVMLKMDKLEASFFKIYTIGKTAPLLLLINDHLTSKDKEDYKVYWSLTEKYPSLEESEGEFSSFDWIMKIPFTANQKTPFIFVGIYT